MNSLPLVRWASRFHRGAVVLRGTADGGDVPVGGVNVGLPRGAVEVRFGFRGGDAPDFERLVITSGSELTIPHGDGCRTGTRLEVEADEVRLDAAWIPCDTPHIGRILEALVERLTHLSVEASGEPDGDLLMRFSRGVRATVPGDARVMVSATTVGDARTLRLGAPLVVRFGGAGIRISHDQLTLLSRLGQVEISRAILHPDGSVDLDTRRNGAVGRALRGGLARASQRLSDLVRTGPQFEHIRGFLQV